jgi:hypothetical protein
MGIVTQAGVSFRLVDKINTVRYGYNRQKTGGNSKKTLMEDWIPLNVLHNTCVDGTLESIIVGIGVGVKRLRRAAVIPTGTFANGFGHCKLLLDGLGRRGQEDDLAVGRFGHGLHRLEVADLHSRGR